MEGTDLLQKIQRDYSETVKIIITGHPDDEHGSKLQTMELTTIWLSQSNQKSC
jgi:hypothetical protein